VKIIIAGSRNFSDYILLKSVLDEFIDVISSEFKNEDIEIVSGGAKGADSLGKTYAMDRGLKFKEFPADWDQLGRGAGYIRNKAMGDYGDVLIAFWDGVSRGTKHMIRYMKLQGKAVRIVNF